ncbi:MAG: hypothetical protein WC254_05050 [Candidatus Woesearchaeota archaeon]|jgi:hypothetical protein
MKRINLPEIADFFQGITFDEIRDVVNTMVRGRKDDVRVGLYGLMELVHTTNMVGVFTRSELENHASWENMKYHTWEFGISSSLEKLVIGLHAGQGGLSHAEKKLYDSENIPLLDALIRDEIVGNLVSLYYPTHSFIVDWFSAILEKRLPYHDVQMRGGLALPFCITLYYKKGKEEETRKCIEKAAQKIDPTYKLLSHEVGKTEYQISADLPTSHEIIIMPDIVVFASEDRAMYTIVLEWDYNHQRTRTDMRYWHHHTFRGTHAMRLELLEGLYQHLSPVFSLDETRYLSAVINSSK